MVGKQTGVGGKGAEELQFDGDRVSAVWEEEVDGWW